MVSFCVELYCREWAANGYPHGRLQLTLRTEIRKYIDMWIAYRYIRNVGESISPGGYRV
jgi:hypothetical protein